MSGTAVHLDEILERAELHSSRGQNQILRVDRVYDVHRGKPFGLQGCGIDVHRNQALFSAVRKGKRRALHRRKLRANEVVSKIKELLLA